jgi:acyl-coenzyme A thioesterase PaaI-like protein
VSDAPLVDAERVAMIAKGLEETRSAPGGLRQEAARSVGEAVRLLIDRFTATAAPAEVLSDVEDRIRAVADMLTGYSASRGYEGLAEASGLGHDRAFFDWSPLLGLANPLAPPLQAEVHGDTLIAHATFGSAYEGPPGCVHGGYVAAAFDDILGLTQSMSGQVGMTGTLTIRYRQPTPLHTDLRFECRIESINGRKVTATGLLFAGDVLTAEASGLFITITPERFRALSAYRERFGSSAGDGSTPD